MHLEAMRRSLKNGDPDLKVLEQYKKLTADGTIKKRKFRPEPQSESESEVRLHIQFTSQIPVDPPIVQSLRKSARSTQSAPLRKQETSKKRQMRALVSTQALITDILPLISHSL
jgi:hypothetical protein